MLKQMPLAGMKVVTTTEKRDETNELHSPGSRLKFLRQMSRLTRAYLEKNHSLPSVTLKSWENGTARLTHKGLSRCIAIYRQEGIVCSKEWIMVGKGLNPRFAVDLGKYFAQDRRYAQGEQTEAACDAENENTFALEGLSEDLCMAKEASFFKEAYADSVVMVVPDENMSPNYHSGDYIGGRFCYGEDIQRALNKDCIVRLQDGSVTFRRLYKSEHAQGYHLSLINPLASTAVPVLFNKHVEAAAPVIWHRKPNVE